MKTAEDLRRNLEEQKEALDAYLDLCGRQRQALLKNDMLENQALNGEAETASFALARLEEERHLLVERLADLHGVTLPARCLDLVPFLPPPEAEAVSRLRHELQGRMEKLKEALFLNLALVQNGRKVIHTTIGIVTSVVGRGAADRLSGYGPQGALRRESPQVRALFQRSA